MITPARPCWIDGELHSGDDYLRRVEAVRARSEALCLTRSWIAGQVGRSRGHVSRVLTGRTRGVETLLLIESLVARVEAREVTPR